MVLRCHTADLDSELAVQESEIDADSIRSRFRFLIPIMLGACHVMACILWYVGTYNLPLTNITCTPADLDLDAVNTNPTCQDYTDRLSKHWLSGYSGIVPIATNATQCC